MTNSDKFEQAFGLYATELWAMTETEFLTWLNADAQPERKPGRWDVRPHEVENQTFDECVCSECGCVEYFNVGWKRFNFCPSCGAKMEVNTYENSGTDR